MNFELYMSDLDLILRDSKLSDKQKLEAIIELSEFMHDMIEHEGRL